MLDRQHRLKKEQRNIVCQYLCKQPTPKRQESSNSSKRNNELDQMINNIIHGPENQSNSLKMNVNKYNLPSISHQNVQAKQNCKDHGEVLSDE